jgi:putative peptidoglycan lipid II flippase
MTVGAANVFVQVLSFGSSIALATQLGATTETDAYYLALSVPVVTYGILLAAVQLGAIPVLTRAEHRSREEFLSGCNQVVSATVVGATVIAVVVTGVMVALLPALSGGSGLLKSHTREFMLELSPYAVTGAMIGVLGGILAVRGRFVVMTVFLGIEPVLKTILMLLLHRQLGAQTLIIGNLAGNLLVVAILVGLIRREGIALRPVGFRSSPLVRALLKLSLPLVISQSVLQLNPLIDRTTAASVGAGSVTQFELGFRLFSASGGILVASILAPLAATWAARLAADGWEAVIASFSRVVVGATLLTPPLIVLGVVLRHELVDIAYRSHVYGAAAISHTADVLGILLVSLLPQLLIVALATLFVIRKDTIFPMKVGIANCVINAVLDVILRIPLGVAGIALSTTLTVTILCIAYIRGAERRWGTLRLREAVRPLKIAVASCAAMAASGAMILTLLPSAPSRLQEVGIVAAVVALGAVIYAAFVLPGGALARADLFPTIGRGRDRADVAPEPTPPSAERHITQTAGITPLRVK